MKQQLIALLVFATLCASVAAFGAELPKQNEKLAASGHLALRATSPDSSFGTKGEKIGWIQTGDRVKVLSAKQVSTVYGFEVWVEVQSENAQGWVYDGMAPDVLEGRALLVPTEDLVIAKAI
ncbi:MAG TPA: hypothetical protein VIH99_01205 [Bdellovibrionota bacterium]|jgi:hypothetical protein